MGYVHRHHAEVFGLALSLMVTAMCLQEMYVSSPSHVVRLTGTHVVRAKTMTDVMK